MNLVSRSYPRKVELSLDHLGAPVLTMVEQAPDGDLHYYMMQDGSWRQYDPSKQSPEAFSNDRVTEWVDGTDWKLLK